MISGQVAVEMELGEGATVTVGGSAFSYDNLKGSAPLVDATDGFGNSVIETVDPVTGESTFSYANEFMVYEGFAQLKTSIGELPFSVFGNVAINDDATSEDTGYAVGAKLGKVKEPGDVEGSVVYRDLEKDAVLGALTDSDFGGGGTDSDGFKVSGKLGVGENWTAGATVFLNQLGSKSADYTRVQVDLVAKF